MARRVVLPMVTNTDRFAVSHGIGLEPWTWLCLSLKHETDMPPISPDANAMDDVDEDKRRARTEKWKIARYAADMAEVSFPIFIL